MTAFLAGKLAREKNGRFGKAWFGKRGIKKEKNRSLAKIQSFNNIQYEIQIIITEKTMTGNHEISRTDESTIKTLTYFCGNIQPN